MVNQQYRHRSPDYFANSSPQHPTSAAKRTLQKFQEALSARANPFAFEGQGYLPLANPFRDSPLGDLITQIATRGYSQSPYGSVGTRDAPAKQSGSRHVTVNINLLNDESVPESGLFMPRSLRTPAIKGQTLRLHYYQDGNQEIVLLKDVSRLKPVDTVPQTGVLDALNKNRPDILSQTQSTRYSSNDTVVMTRKVGEQNFQSLDAGEAASNFLQQSFEGFQKIRQIQEFTDTSLEANSAFVITPSRSALDAEEIAKNNKNLIDFYPGLRQGFSFGDDDGDSLTASKILSDHYRAKYSSHTSDTNGNIRLFSQQVGINSELYQNYGFLSQSRQNALDAGHILPSDVTTSRNNHLMHGGSLIFGHLETLLSNDQQSIDQASRFRDDLFQSRNSFVLGNISTFNIRKSFAEKPYKKIPEPQQDLGFSVVNNAANSALQTLKSLNGSIDLNRIANRVKQSLQAHRSISFSDQTSQFGNIDVSAAFLRGIQNPQDYSSARAFVIDLSFLAENSRVNINWQFGN